MDEVAKGMSQSGRRAEGKPETNPNDKNLSEKVTDWAKDTAQKVKEGVATAGEKIKEKMS